MSKIFGDKVWTAKTETETELETALEQIEANRDKLCFIEVVMDKMGSPDLLRKIAEMTREQNKY